MYFKFLCYRQFNLLLSYWVDSIYHNQWEKDFLAKNMKLQPVIKTFQQSGTFRKRLRNLTLYKIRKRQERNKGWHYFRKQFYKST